MKESVGFVTGPSGEERHLVLPVGLNQMIGEGGEVGLVMPLVAIVHRQLGGAADNSLDWSVVGVLAKGKIRLMEDLRHTLEGETKLCFLTGLLVQDRVLFLAIVVAVVQHSTTGASVRRGATTTLTRHDEWNGQVETFSGHTLRPVVIHLLAAEDRLLQTRMISAHDMVSQNIQCVFRIKNRNPMIR